MPGPAPRFTLLPAHVRAQIARIAIACALIAGVARAAEFPGTAAALLAPADGARVVESAARFAFSLPEGVRSGTLLLSRRPFDPAAWTEIRSSTT
jgi:hypothetical protein